MIQPHPRSGQPRYIDSPISDASARSRQKLGVLCCRGLSRPGGGLWAWLLGLLGSEVLLGTGRPLVWRWGAASWGTGRVKDWANIPGVLGVHGERDTLRSHRMRPQPLSPPHAKPSYPLGLGIPGSIVFLRMHLHYTRIFFIKCRAVYLPTHIHKVIKLNLGFR